MNITITQTQKEQIEKIVEETTTQFIEDLPQTVRNCLRGGAFNIIGLEYGRYGADKWGIDHCNGRATILSKIVAEQCQENIDKFLVPIANQAIVEMAKDEEFLLALVQEAKDTFQRIFYEAVKSQAAVLAKSQAESLFSQGTEFKVLISPDTDINDPKAHTSKLGHILAERVAKNILAGAPAMS